MSGQSFFYPCSLSQLLFEHHCSPILPLPSSITTVIAGMLGNIGQRGSIFHPLTLLHHSASRLSGLICPRAYVWTWFILMPSRSQNLSVATLDAYCLYLSIPYSLFISPRKWLMWPFSYLSPLRLSSDWVWVIKRTLLRLKNGSLLLSLLHTIHQL